MFSEDSVNLCITLGNKQAVQIALIPISRYSHMVLYTYYKDTHDLMYISNNNNFMKNFHKLLSLTQVFSMLY